MQDQYLYREDIMACYIMVRNKDAIRSWTSIDHMISVSELRG